MRKTYFKILKYTICIIVLYSNFAQAEGILNNLSGDVGIEYREDEEISFRKKKTSLLSEVINLQYNDYLYDKRIIDYIINLSLKKNEKEISDNNQTNDSTYDTTEYDVNLNFLPLSNMPFQIKAKQTEKPSTIINEDSIVETVFNQSKYSLNGKVKSNFANVNYYFNSTSTDSETQQGLKENNNQLYGVTISKQLKDEGIVTFGYSEDKLDTKDFYGDFLKQNNSRKSMNSSYQDEKLQLSANYTQRNEIEKDNTNEINSQIDTISTTSTYNIKNNLILTASASNETNSEFNSTQNSANINTTWEATEKYTASLNLDLNEYEVSNQNYNNYMLNFNSNYLINNEMSNSQNLSYLDVITPTSTHKSYLLSTGTNYNKEISPKTNLFINNTLSHINNINNSLDPNAPLENDKSFIFDFTIGTNKSLAFWNSKHGYSFNYNRNFSDEITSSEEFKINTFLNSLPSINTAYNLEVNVSNEDKAGINSTSYNIRNHFMYRHNFDIRGNLTINASLNYRVENFINQETKSLDPSLSTNFSYLLWSHLTFKSIYDMIRDQDNKTTNHTLNTGLYYKYRKVQIDLKTFIIKQYKDLDDDFESKSILLTVKRTF